MSLIVGYDANWSVWFEQLRLRFDEALVGIPHTIEHVGSTAIPGMAAKPIIDLDIVVEPGRLAETIERLSASGYVHEGDLGCPGREAFDVKDKTLKASCRGITHMSASGEIVTSMSISPFGTSCGCIPSGSTG